MIFSAMTWVVLASGAFAGDLVVDAKVPCEVIGKDGQRIAQIFWPSKLRVAMDAGQHDLVVMVSGKPRNISVQVPDTDQHALLIVGRNGLSASVAEKSDDDKGTQTQLELRSTGSEDLVVQLGHVRHQVPAGKSVSLDLPHGAYPTKLRSAQGTIIYARGTLYLDGETAVVQVSEGRMPELSGEGVRFSPDAEK